MKPISRRTCLQRLASLPATWMMGGLSFGQDSAVKTGDEAVRALAEDFIKKFESPGFSVAFAKDGKLLYQGCFGLADQRAKEVVNVNHRFRIASVSKPITSVAVYGLVEQGKLKLDDRVFGKQGLLPRYKTSRDRDRMEAITVHHLLTHTSGGWGNSENDPMFQNPEMNHEKLIAWTLQEIPLVNDPGEKYDYSNFGYCLLGRVIEKVTNTPYADYVQQQVLGRCGIKNMAIAGNTLRERAENEVVYYGNKNQNPYGMNVRRMDAHGGWMATPTDMLRLLVQVDGFPNTPDILKPETIDQMTKVPPGGKGYASGWAVNGAPNWWHNGSLPGTSSIAVRTAGGLCWAGFANTRSEDMGNAMDSLMWKISAVLPPKV